MIQTLALGAADRVLVLAPHPDDESAASGGLLQHALAAGARTRIVFFTDGDNNPWAQRATELRWRIATADRARFAAKRREEVRAALACLGVAEAAVRWLGYPDQSTTDLLLHGNEIALAQLVAEIREWGPTVVVHPSLLDLHPDHSALAVLAQLALDTLGAEVPLRHQVRFLVHNPRLRARHEGTAVLPLQPAQQARKRAALLCHKTQLVLRRSWLPAFAEAEERFYIAESAAGIAEHPIGDARCERSSLIVRVDSRDHWRSLGGRTVCLAAGASPHAMARLAVQLPSRGGATAVVDLRSGHDVGRATFSGDRGRGELTLPASLLPAGERLFAKVERRFGFFDEAGWKGLGSPASQPV